MVSDSVLIERLRQILTVSDLETATAGTVRRKLEEELVVDLLDRKAFVRDQIDVFLRTHVQETPNDDVQEVEDVKEEENGDSCSQEEEEEEKESVENDDNSSETGSKKKARRSEKVNGEEKRKGGFYKPCALSPQLQKLVGEPELGRPEVVKKIWAYIWEKKLQNPQNKRKILCDDVLSGIFWAKAIDMFQMNKALSKHIWPIDEKDAAEVKSSVKSTQKQGREEGENKLLEVQKAMLSAFSRLLCNFLQVDFRIPNNFGFEAFMVSTRMEGRIEGLEKTMGKVQDEIGSANPTKDTDMMAENSYNRRSDEFWEVRPQFREETRPRRLELPLFSSDNPYGWLNRAERYFHFNGIDDKEKLEAAAVCFEGNLYVVLMGLQQTGSVAQYREDFELLSAPLKDANDAVLMGIFTKGLRGYVAWTRRLCRRTRPDTTPVRTLARNSSQIRSNESGDVDQHQEESWLPYRKGETGEGRKSAIVIVVAGGRVIVAGISIGKKENSDL
ncbi:Protein TRI1 [Capsicum baccatum]|uniref:Protein TRI1 n=1 Tax=Capsicum baccatum TaxID=33114 RepID=A0A2G2XQZ7_CAPBA|nr:Protein TRI1 [Capsicum baccatum]